MCEGECWCLRGFVDGKLREPLILLNVKELIMQLNIIGGGDTEGILHHATVPLKAGGEKIWGVKCCKSG